MAKRALLIGCNYAGTKAELHGCVNDVTRMHTCLVNRFGFDDRDITIMIDTDRNSIQPTGANIKKVLSNLIAESQPGDSLVVHYSGHGTQVPAESGDEEDDGFDEAIVPTDLNLLTDDDFRLLFKPLRQGVFVTFISDSCHSGGLIDQEKEQIGGTSSGGGGGLLSGILGKDFDGGFLETRLHQHHGHGEEDRHHHFHHHREEQHHPNRTAASAVNKSLSIETLTEMMSNRTGQNVQVGNIRTTLFNMFGKDSSPTVKVFMNVFLDRLNKPDGEEGGGLWGTIGGLAADFLKQKLSGDDGGSSGGIAEVLNNSAVAQSGHAGAKPDPAQRVSEDSIILVSGCMSNETSADANPTGDPSKAYGALSNAIQEVLAGHDGPISNGQLVRSVRSLLAKQGFKQHPCLYCDDENVNVPFISS